MSEPLDSLAGGDRPVTPRSTFVADLRARLIAELAAADPQADQNPDHETDTNQRSSTMDQSPSSPSSVVTTITPYLIVDDGPAAIAFYERAFGGVVTLRLDQPDGRIGHAEIEIAGAGFSLADEFPEMDIVSPTTLGGTSTTLTLTVPDVDAVVARALKAGATVVRDVADQFHGSRSGQILDPFGHRWTISTPGETMSQDEMQRRLDDLNDGDD